MNDLDAALRVTYQARSHTPEPPDLLDEVLAIPDLDSPKQRRWLPLPAGRSQSMFSATKLVVAGAIVALFGGFLLAGVVTQPSDDIAPAALTGSPSPITTEDLLSGMVTEEVEPGVYRVLDDGAGHDLVGDPPIAVTVGPDGSVVLFGAETAAPFSERIGTSNPFIGTVYTLGQQASWDATGESGSPSEEFWFDAAVDHEGSLWARLEADCCQGHDHLGRHDGLLGQVDTDAWTMPTWPDGSDGVNAIEVAADGTIWVTQRTTGPGPKVARITDGTWTVLSNAEDGLPVGEYQGESSSFAVGPDGTAWLSTGANAKPVPGVPGLLHYDGERWTQVELPVDPRFEYVGPLAVGSDGTLWVYVAEHLGQIPASSPLRADRRLLRLRDGDWQVFDDVPGLAGLDVYEARLVVDADGTLWVAFGLPAPIDLPASLDPVGPRDHAHGVVSFDGSTWRQYLGDDMVNRIAMAPDGSVWATSLWACGDGFECEWEGDEPGGLYVITPEAVAATK